MAASFSRGAGYPIPTTSWDTTPRRRGRPRGALAAISCLVLPVPVVERLLAVLRRVHVHYVPVSSMSLALELQKPPQHGQEPLDNRDWQDKARYSC